MNKALLSNVEVAISEGHSSAIGQLYHNLYEYKTLCNKIIETQKQIEALVSEEHLETVKQCARAQSNKAYFEQRFMYIQGMKDYSDILRFLDDGALDKYLLDYNFKYENED